MKKSDLHFWPYKPKVSIISAIILLIVLLLITGILRSSIGRPPDTSTNIVLIGILLISLFPVLLAILDLKSFHASRAAARQWELLGPLEPPQPPNIYYAIPISPAWMQGSLAINHGWMAFSTVSGLPNELLAEQFLQNELGEIIEKKEGSKHINIVRLDEIFKPVLNKKKIEKNWSNDRQTNALLSSEAPFIAITENGSYSAIVSIQLLINEVLRSMLNKNQTDKT